MSIDKMIKTLQEIKEKYSGEDFNIIPMDFEILIEKNGEEYCWEAFTEDQFD